jgi:hypothetical protein
MGSGSFGGGGGGGGAWGGGGSPVISLPMIEFHGGRPKARPGSGGGGGGGTAGGGGGGGGTAGGGGGGGRTAGGGGSGVATAGVTADTAALDTVRDALKKQLQFGNPYVTRQFCSLLTDAVYRTLFELSVVFFVNRDWRPIEHKYGVGPGPGCLNALARVIVDRATVTEPDKRVRQVVQLGLDDFFVRALRGNLSTYIGGNAEEVLARLDRKVFDSTSGYFLGFLLLEIVRKTVERPSAEFGDGLRHAAQRVADDLVEAFRRKFYQVNGILYNDLFRVACENREWFFAELRKGAPHGTSEQ